MLQLDESMEIKFDKELVFGSNAEDYDDGKIGFNRPLKLLYLVHKDTENDIFYVCALNFKTGELILSSTNRPNIVQQLRTPMIKRPMNVLHAYRNFGIMYNLMLRIIQRWHMRIPEIAFIATNPSIMKMIERNFRNGAFKMLFKRYRYTVIDYAEQGEDFVYYRLGKTTKKE